jgi:hypothetical protein
MSGGKEAKLVSNGCVCQEATMLLLPLIFLTKFSPFLAISFERRSHQFQETPYDSGKRRPLFDSNHFNRCFGYVRHC